ncbi:hypothetical protein ABBQ38_006602 [Trebouxia sp. C0009 RCD-2024]
MSMPTANNITLTMTIVVCSPQIKVLAVIAFWDRFCRQPVPDFGRSVLVGD